MKLQLKAKKIRGGFTQIVKPENKFLKLIDFGILRLSSGRKFSFKENHRETSVLILSGKCDVYIGDLSFKDIGKRKDVFEDRPYAVYIPEKKSWEIVSKDNNLEVAICRSEITSSVKNNEPKLITPDMVHGKLVGRDNWQRDVYNVIDDRTPAHRLLVGETINPPGNWSSAPPHKHENDNLPDESKHEEVYFFKVKPEQGFGMIRIYTDDRSLNNAYTIENNDVVILPKGYHPVVAGPGYRIYYLWMLSGEGRTLKGKDDPKHEWIKNE